MGEKDIKKDIWSKEYADYEKWELRELYKDLDIVADIKRKCLKLIGHVVRMDQGESVKKYFEVNRKEVEEAEDLH